MFEQNLYTKELHSLQSQMRSIQVIKCSSGLFNMHM